MKRIFVKLLPVVIPRMDHVVAISKVVKRDLVENFDIDASLIQVAYNPVVSDAVLEKQAESVDHPWFENRESPIAISVGRLTEQKNYPLLFRAFAQVRQKRPLRLIVLGEGEQRESLKHLASELGIEEDVSMPGFVENPYPYMREADLFLLSSKWEGLPNVLVEALATNCQIVSTDCPGGPKEVLQEGRYGRLVPIGDVSAYASAIDQALNEEPPDGLQLRQRWSDFTAETVAQDYLRIFEGQKPERN
jgi:glycosyltransferase involved in cell wall biosynthesis